MCFANPDVIPDSIFAFAMVEEGCFSFIFCQSVNRILCVCSIERAFVFVGTWFAYIRQWQ